MKNTRFMDRLFSATEENDEELTSQVSKDIEDAKEKGEVDTDEVNYKSNGDGSVSITDKENGEVTVAEPGEDGGYDLYPAEVTEQIEGFLHPERDGVTPGNQEGAPDEHVEDHPELENGVADSRPYERSVEEEAQEGPCEDGEECGHEEGKAFSVFSENYVVHRIFSDQDFCERIFSEVIESEETAVVGDLKVEKIPGEDAVVVTSEETGDQARVDLSHEDMEVTELDSKNFNECEDCDDEEGIADEVAMGDDQYLPLHVVGLDSFNHQLIDAVEYDEESAQELVEDLEERGIVGVQVFECPDEARDYAMSLLDNLGVESEEDIEEPEQAEFSDHEIYVTRFYSNNTDFMTRLFSEAVCDINASQDAIEDAIENGDEIETEDEIITPIDAVTAVVEDKDSGEFTKVVLDGDEMDLKPIEEDEADELMEDLAVEEEGKDEDEDKDDDEEEKDFSDIWCNEDETRFFSETEIITSYMQRIFSEEADQDEVEDAIESGEEIENDDEIITPVDAKTAVIEDKETGEFTKATIESDDDMNIEAISEEEADDLMEDLAVEDKDEEDEKEFSDVWCNEEETRFFSENEVITDYMGRLFSEEADQDEIEDAIESGEQIENDNEVITPVDAKTAVIEDKETGEFTKATIESDDDMNIEAISEEEADDLTDGLAVEESDEEKKFSTLDKFFAEVAEQVAAQNQQDPNAAQQAPAQPAAPEEDQNNAEVIEDKAQAAINAIQEMVDAAREGIEEAKQAPVETEDNDLREAQFSEIDEINNTALNWLGAVTNRQ